MTRDPHLESCKRGQADKSEYTQIHDGIIPVEQIPSVKVSVAAGKAVHYAEHARLSEYSDYQVIYEVTEGRVGGARPGDDI
jgi:tyrosinase